MSNPKHVAVNPDVIVDLAERHYNALVKAYNSTNEALKAEGYPSPALNVSSYIALRVMFERSQVMEQLITEDTLPIVENIVRIFKEELEAKRAPEIKPVANA